MDREHGEGKIVAVYQTEHAVVRISNAGFANKTREQIERDKRNARIVACRIVQRAMERGQDADCHGRGAASQ